MFERLLLREIQCLDASRPVFVDGESKKIGELQVPDALMERMRASRCIVLGNFVEHYDPAYHRSSTRNFARLGDAQKLIIASAQHSALATAARSLLEVATVTA